MNRNTFAVLAAVAAASASAASRMELRYAGYDTPDGSTWHYRVVVSEAAASDPAWRAVADALAAKYSKAPFDSSVSVANPTNALGSLIPGEQWLPTPRYVAFVMKPEEAGADTVFRLHDIMKSLDDDPFYDAVWGIVTGPTADAAMHLATARGVHPQTALSTTGIDFRPFDDATAILDAYAPGTRREEYMQSVKPVAVVEKRGGAAEATRIVRGDTTAEFAAAWDALDPELVVTSAHASQGNLEMPFSTGNIVPRKGKLWTLPKMRLIDYSTGQAAKGSKSHAARAKLAAPKRDKIWIAAGNCLIGDYKGNDSMAAAIIGYARAVQFMGYVKTTWFGEIGWESLGQFMNNRASAGEAWYFAGQNLERKLALMKKDENDIRYAGRIWDRDATILWGDPALDASLEEGRLRQPAKLTGLRTRGGIALTFEALEDLEAKEDKVEEVRIVHPFGIILPRAPRPYEVKTASALGVFAADDFALVTSWPSMKKGEKAEVILRVPGGR